MKRIGLSVVFIFLGWQSFAQIQATQYFMNSLPQVTDVNPAFIPKYKFSLGLPGLSSIATTYSNNGFKYKDLITKSGGETKADLSQWNKSLTDKNYITSTTQIDLLRIGFKVNKKLYMQLSASAKEYARVLLPKELTSLAVQGTAPLIGSSTHFSPSGEGLAYLESALSAAYVVDEKLTLGIRVKYLKGIANATTTRSDLSVAVTKDYAITAAADMNIRTSGVYNATQSGYSFGDEFHHYMSNSGGGIDLGGSYKLTDKITLSASLIDFGKITWKNNVYDYTLNKATANYTFNGIDADKLVQGNSNYLSAQGDSISNKFVFQKTQGASYSTWLPAKIYAGASYRLAQNLNAGLVVYSEKFRGRFATGATASINKHFGRWVSTSLSYTASNRSFNNFGAGVSFNLAPVQIYLVGDNLLNAPVSLIATQRLNSYINNTQVFSLRFGLNFVIGWDKGFEKAPKPTGPPTPKAKRSGANYIKARRSSKH